jgi:hypothetical protein
MRLGLGGFLFLDVEKGDFVVGASMGGVYGEGFFEGGFGFWDLV